MDSSQVAINFNIAQQLAELLTSTDIPSEQESSEHAFSWKGTMDELANSYFAIVGICHQTSPIGERRLQGKVNGETKYGWDYLKEKFLIAATENAALSTPEYWQTFTPQRLAVLYQDKEYGITLNRVNERVFLLNDLGRLFVDYGFRHIRDVFNSTGRIIGGDDGFLRFASRFHAYRDPLHKKSLFFLSLALNECGWSAADPESLLSPIDYHELRGHLRIGSIVVLDNELSKKLNLGLPVTDKDDLPLRKAAQDVNNWIAEKAHLTNSALHYLLWNVFRSCCPRPASESHCSDCPSSCQLPERYKQMNLYSGHCLFAGVCMSAHQPVKLSEPPYIGNYY